MPTELDHVAIINRIIQILQNDSELYDSSGAGGKIRQWFNGMPSTVQTPPYLAIYVLNELDVPMAPVVSNVLQQSEHMFTYELLLVDIGKTSDTSEQGILGWVKRIKEVIKGNYSLQDPTLHNDSKVFTCHPKQTVLSRGTLPTPISKPGVAAVMQLELYATTA